jgi:hypothetical protein
MNQLLIVFFTMWIAPAFGKWVGNSTQILTDLATVIATPLSATAVARAINPSGPIEDLPGMLSNLQLSFKEIAEKLAYILEGTMVQTSLTAPSGGLITTSSDSASYNLLVGIYQMIK